MKYVLILLALCFACKNKKGASIVSNASSINSPGPHVIVYKTSKNFLSQVPVMLSDDKTEIISYPHPIDIKTRDGYAYPTKLSQGYLLDNRGIGINVAFLRYTYEEYSKLQSVPLLSELYDLIVDKDPIIEMCDCGNKKNYKDIEAEINEIIAKGELYKKCQKLK
jgi:hypothetical protein